ncbi:MAG: hypothetical protein R6V62_09050 [Candidatus Fermentibacteraceae bacterium]
MIKWSLLLPLLCCVLPLHASQVFHMSLDEVMGLAETVFVARVDSVAHTPFEYTARVDFRLSVTEVLLGPDSLAGTSLDASYTMDLPSVYVDADGTEIWESPVVFGSGIETSVSVGDTVVAVAERCIEGHALNLVRLEGVERLDEVSALIQMLDHPQAYPAKTEARRSSETLPAE